MLASQPSRKQFLIIHTINSQLLVCVGAVAPKLDWPPSTGLCQADHLPPPTLGYTPFIAVFARKSTHPNQCTPFQEYHIQESFQLMLTTSVVLLAVVWEQAHVLALHSLGMEQHQQPVLVAAMGLTPPLLWACWHRLTCSWLRCCRRNHCLGLHNWLNSRCGCR